MQPLPSAETGRINACRNCANKQCIFVSRDNPCQKCADNRRPCGEKLPPPRQREQINQREHRFRLSPTPTPARDVTALVDEAMDEIRATIQRIIEGYDNARHLTRQDLIDHFVEVHKGQRAQEEREVERIRAHRTVNQGNADPHRGAHLKLHNLVHCSPDSRTYFQPPPYLTCRSHDAVETQISAEIAAFCVKEASYRCPTARRRLRKRLTLAVGAPVECMATVVLGSRSVQGVGMRGRLCIGARTSRIYIFLTHHLVTIP